jgi:NADP-dependent 3-hydroxy acid dehydrogenase YdfG
VKQAVKQAALRCKETGAAEAVGLVADVTDPRQMEALASAAMERFGRIDVWVNMAGLSMWGTFEAIPVEAQARLVQVNLIGVMNGCHAALPHMLRQGRGVLINMSSAGGRMPLPFAAAYTASKIRRRRLHRGIARRSLRAVGREGLRRLSWFRGHAHESAFRELHRADAAPDPAGAGP